MHTVLGKSVKHRTINETDAACPSNFYSVTKRVNEQLGKHVADRFGLSVIALRIGWVLQGDTRPGPRMGPVEHQQLWLSNRDLCRGVECAIRAPNILLAIINLISDNQGMCWDLSTVARVLGWTPVDRYNPQPPPSPGDETKNRPWRKVLKQLCAKQCVGLDTGGK